MIGWKRPKQDRTIVMEFEQQLAKQLFDSIRAEDEQLLIDALERGAPLDALDPEDDINEYNGVTPFLYAVNRGWEAGCKLLFEYGADLHETDNNGANAMHYNAWQAYANQEQRNIALFLLEHGIAFDAATEADDTAMRMGKTPIMVAANWGNSWGVNLLLQQGAEVNRKDADECTALVHAARIFHLDIVKTLISHGADTAVEVPFPVGEGTVIPVRKGTSSLPSPFRTSE